MSGNPMHAGGNPNSPFQFTKQDVDVAFHAGRDSSKRVEPFRNQLFVSDIEKLAKAGVAVNLDNVSVLLDPAPSPTVNHNAADRLEQMFWYRYNMAHPANEGFSMPFSLAAEHRGDTVYVFVAPGWGPHPARDPHPVKPFIIEDIAACYPSDKLMASIALLEKTSP